ncbi:hypothetical protein BJX96DRAFT_151133, partial [Aspergillus floccosus]
MKLWTQIMTWAWTCLCNSEGKTLQCQLLAMKRNGMGLAWRQYSMHSAGKCVLCLSGSQRRVSSLPEMLIRL